MKTGGRRRGIGVDRYDTKSIRYVEKKCVQTGRWMDGLRGEEKKNWKKKKIRRNIRRDRYII